MSTPSPFYADSFETAFDSAPFGMALMDLDGQWMRVNDALCELLGFSREEMVDMDFRRITHPDDVEAGEQALERLVGGEIEKDLGEKRYITKSGEVIWALVAVSLVYDDLGVPLNFVTQTQDITDRKRDEVKLRRLASEDPLTGLANRRQLEERLDDQLERSARYGERAALLLLDLDGFKGINDRYGHTAGDQILKTIADDLRDRLRRHDVIARLGGDEFAILMIGADAPSAEWLAQQLTDHFDRRSVQVDGGTTASCGMSIGAAAITGREKNIEDVIARADRAMYAVKQSRRAEA